MIVKRVFKRAKASARADSQAPARRRSTKPSSDWVQLIWRSANLICASVFCVVVCARAQALAQDVRVVFIGDSITAGYGVLKEESFPERLEQLLSKRESEKGIHLVVTNAGISGSLSSSAVSRVRYYMKLKPQIIVLELGGNDGLKGTEVTSIRKNLSEAIDLALASKVKVLLIGMQIYSNFGDAYTKSFAKIFSELAHDKKVELMPFLLDKIALDKTLMQSDQKHPNPKGHQIIAENLVKYLDPMIASVAKEIPSKK